MTERELRRFWRRLIVPTAGMLGVILALGVAALAGLISGETRALLVVGVTVLWITYVVGLIAGYSARG